MKKTAVVFALIIFSMAIVLPFSADIQSANAQTVTYSVQNVEHNVQVLYSGHVVVAEKIQLSGSASGTFELGLPFRYAPSILEVTAYDKDYNVLPVVLGVQLQSQSGLYGVSVNLPAGTSEFTVFFVLSNAVLTTTSTGYNLDFPVYLALPATVNSYNGNITLPAGANVVGIDKPDGVVNASTYNKQNLAAFTNAPATATISASYGVIQEVNMPFLDRKINITPSGDVTCTDNYKIDNNSTTGIASFLINLPVGASNIVARDQFGRVLSTKLQQSNSLGSVQNVTFEVFIGVGESNVITLDYSLPSISDVEASQYILNLDLFPYLNYYVDSASVTVTPPEGATITSPNLSDIGSSADLSRDVFQESLTIKREGVSYIDSLAQSEDVVPITFNYNPLWISFRPTSWVWVIALVGVVVVAFWKRPKAKAKTKAVTPITPKVTPAKAPTGAKLSAEKIQEFVEAYEEKQRITQEIKALEARVRHGRIPRRRYKVQRKTLEIRLESLSQTVAEGKALLASAGGNYADTAKELEAVEVELNDVELSLQPLGERHEADEISNEEYQKQLTDLEQRKENAKAVVDELLQGLHKEVR
ncbi:MAG: hypothetical protein NWF00_07950 [Candidatus Bathyarchaeota archaeon]|nr:hypothetical protein [Candidatus Bathyarchaeota archaeon]